MLKVRTSLLLFISILFLEFGSLQAACNLAGTAGNDIVYCTGVINSFQQFYGGDDRVTLNNVTALTTNNVYWLDESLGGNIATDGNDTFISDNSQFYWILSFGGNDVFDINNSEFNNLYADTNPGHGTSQRGNDTIHIDNSTSYGYILGGNDNDYIEIKDSNVSNVASGYSNIYAGTDYSPFDGNDTIILDHVNFDAPLYWSTTATQGLVEGGRGDDNITFTKGGEAYYVYGGHGNDHIEFFDNEHFNDCNSSVLSTDKCGIYGDEPYASELNTSMTPLLHGDDTILLHSGDFSRIFIQGGDGSDTLTIETPVSITDTLIDGGDDRDNTDTFIDQLNFMQWSGDLNGSNLIHWEQIILDDASDITFIDSNISVGNNTGIELLSTLPYGLIVRNSATLNIYHDFLIDGNLHNAAVLNIQDANTPGQILTINNNYSANNGEVYLDTTLNNALPSSSDSLLIKGDTQGTTTLHINNINGSGGQTPIGDNQGILVIEVQGASNGQFILDNAPIIVGEYRYNLVKGSNGNWYLQSHKDIASIKLIKRVNAINITKTQMLHYTITLKNTGNVALTNIQVIDTFPNNSQSILALQSGDINQNNKLDLNEEWIYLATFPVTQSDIDKGETLKNKAQVTTSEAVASTGFAYTQIKQKNTYSFTKSTISNPQHIGDCLSYTFSVKNKGNTRLKVNKITDENCLSDIKLLSESLHGNGILDINETQIFTCTSYPVTAFESTCCQVINIANIEVKTNLSNIILKEKTSTVITAIHIPNSCTCDNPFLQRPPLMPSDAKTLMLSSTSATLQWKDNAFDELGYKIYQNNKLIATLGKNVHTLTLNNLKPNTTYTYMIRSYNTYGTSYRTMITFTSKNDYAWFPAIYNLLL